MLFRTFSRWLGVGLLVALAGCASARVPSATLIDPNAPTFPPAIVLPTITEPSDEPAITPAPTTSTTLAPTTASFIAVNGLVPRTGAEREVLVAATAVLEKRRHTFYRIDVTEDDLREIYVDPVLTVARNFLAGQRKRDELSRPGSISIVLFRTLTFEGTDAATLVMCGENDGQVFRRNGTDDPSDDVVVQSGLAGGVLQLSLVRFDQGWRISEVELLERFRGSKCGA